MAAGKVAWPIRSIPRCVPPRWLSYDQWWCTLWGAQLKELRGRHTKLEAQQEASLAFSRKIACAATCLLPYVLA